jgi:hypothetical protein
VAANGERGLVEVFISPLKVANVAPAPTMSGGRCD